MASERCPNCGWCKKLVRLTLKGDLTSHKRVIERQESSNAAQ